MAKNLILQNLSKLARGIGASHNKWTGTKTNISFLGKGPTRNPLFQGPLQGLESEAQLGSRESIISAVEDAMGYASAGKLNPIQLEALTLNLESLNKIYNPPVLPMASVSRFPKRGSGITTLEGVDPRETILPMQRSTFKSALPEPGIQQFNKDLSTRLGVTAMLEQKTGMSRAIARQILQQDTRLNLKPEELFSLRTGAKGEDPLDLMRKYYGESMLKYDDFLNQVNLEAAAPAEFAEMILKNVKLIPQFASGGLARILEI